MTEFVDRTDWRIAYERVGSGPPLVLMHGAEASRLMFAPLIPELAAHFTVIAYDQRDCGETQGPQCDSTLKDLADDAHFLIRALGFKRAHVFGSSFGGRVAQALALLHPQIVDRLVLGSTWPLPRALEEFNPDVSRIVELRRTLPESAQELADWFFPQAFLQERPELRNLFANVQPSSARSERRNAAVRSTLDQGVSGIVAPTLLLAGELDRVVPAAVTLSMAARIRQCEAILLPSIGHVTALQAPTLIAEHLRRYLLSVQPNAT